MERELRIESDEAYDLAHELAQRLDVTPSKAVEMALRTYRLVVPAPAAPVEDDDAFAARILAMGADVRAKLGPLATSNHDEFYDENGFPR